MGTDLEVVEVIAFAVSERARWVNGALIPVDGAQGPPFGGSATRRVVRRLRVVSRRARSNLELAAT